MVVESTRSGRGRGKSLGETAWAIQGLFLCGRAMPSSIARVVPNCNSASLIVPNLDQHWLCDFHSDRCFFIAGSFSLSKNPTVGVGLSGLSTGLDLTLSKFRIK